MRRLALVMLMAASVAVTAAAATGTRTFYLDVRLHQCLIRTASPKWVAVVPCANPHHQSEVYAIRHGGWGHGTPPTARTGFTIARSLCLAAFQQLTGHVLPSTAGWYAFWPDPGVETARYGDKIICSYRAWPRLARSAAAGTSDKPAPRPLTTQRSGDGLFGGAGAQTPTVRVPHPAE